MLGKGRGTQRSALGCWALAFGEVSARRGSGGVPCAVLRTKRRSMCVALGPGEPRYLLMEQQNRELVAPLWLDNRDQS